MNERTGRNALTVTEVNEYVRMLLDGNPGLRDIWVSGELSGVKLYSSGHLYFSLKDADSVLSAVMFRGSVARLAFTPEDGMRVLVHGRISSYVPRGQYQLNADSMVPDGAGALAVAFEQLKRRLEAEGLFDPARKKPLPPHPRRIGVITSPSGAAVHDIIRVARGRCAATELLIFPTPVQGAEAAAYLAGGVSYFNAVSDDPEQAVDLIIIGRGGGSAEDLWAFNDERLARTVAASKIPVVSAVGHEVDFTICDFVADVRAATPSAAAEIALPDGEELIRLLHSLEARLTASVTARITRHRAVLGRLSASRVLSAPEAAYTRRRESVARLGDGLERAMTRCLAERRRELGHRAAQLEALSPLSVLSRGYALVQNEEGCVVPSAGGLTPGESATLRFSDGRVGVTVNTIEVGSDRHE